MVVTYYKNGQLGNRLLHAATLIANSLEYNYKLYYLSFPHTYTEYFNLDYNTDLRSITVAFRYSKYIVFEFTFTIINYILLQLAKKTNLPFLFYLDIIPSKRKSNSLYYDLTDSRYLNRAKNSLVYVDGWRFTDARSLDKHLPCIRTLFKPKDKYLDTVNKIMLTASSFGKIIIGIHIRRGDYRDYNSGKWYFDDSVYERNMREAQKCFSKMGDAHSCVFLICSDESIDNRNFDGLPAIYFKKSEIVDLYTLATCNYIIGVPSTFCGWASYYGSVPIFYIENSTRIFNLEQLSTGFHSHFTKEAPHCKNYYEEFS